VTREFTTGRLDPETKGIVDEVDNHTFTVEVATPAAFSVVPFTPRTGAGFVPSIVFVAIPEITFAATRVVTRAAVARETTTVVQGDGTVTSRTVDQPGPSVTSHVWGLETTTSLRHHLVVRLESESATIDISLNGSSILDWDDLSIQAVIPY